MRAPTRNDSSACRLRKGGSFSSFLLYHSESYSTKTLPKICVKIGLRFQQDSQIKQQTKKRHYCTQIFKVFAWYNVKLESLPCFCCHQYMPRNYRLYRNIISEKIVFLCCDNKELFTPTVISICFLKLEQTNQLQHVQIN